MADLPRPPENTTAGATATPGPLPTTEGAGSVERKNEVRNSIEGEKEVRISIGDDKGSQNTSEADLKKDGKDGDSSDSEEDKKKKEEEEKGGIKDYFRIFGQGDTLDHVLQVIAVIMSCGSGAGFPLMTIVFGKLLTKLTEGLTGGVIENKAEYQRTINQLAVYFVYIFIGKFVAGFIGAVFFRITATRISARIRINYMKALFQQDVGFLDTVGSGEVAVRITTNSNTIQTGISERLCQFWQALSMFIAAAVIAFTYSWELTLVTLTMLPLIVIIYSFTIAITLRKDRVLEEALGKAATLAQEILATMRTVKAFNAEKKLSDRYQAYLDEAKRIGYSKTTIMAIQYSCGFGIMWAGTALCFWYGVRIYIQGKTTEAGDLFVVLFSVVFLVMAFALIAMPLKTMSEAATACRKLFEVIDREPEMKQAPEEGLKPENIKMRISLEDVSFSYPGTRKDVTILNHLNLDFEEGKNTAIVGPSGSGKSTIVSMLERWYDPNVLEDGTQGTVRINGIDVKDLNRNWWRSQVGLVQQEPFLFNDTILRNVAHGLLRLGHDIDNDENLLEKVKEACREANADKFIEKLPDGYNSKVGEGGVKLSGGQKQRIAIARSIISEPSILILDEATSALDPKSEAIVQQCLDRLSKSRTTITIAHRLSTIKKADKIVVLEKGTAVESGTQEELLQIEGGKYAALVAGQKLSVEPEDNSRLDGKLSAANNADAGMDNHHEKETDSDESIHEATDEKKEPEQTNLSIFWTFIKIFKESKPIWAIFFIAFVGAVIAGSGFSLQAFIYSKFINAFTMIDNIPKFEREGNTWALAFFILAIGVGLSYSMLGYSFTKAQYYLTTAFRTEYFANTIRQPISFFDLETSSSGSLASRLNSDPTAIQEMMGMNFGMLLVAVFAVIGCIIISFVFGWKLALVGLFACLPFVLGAGVVRVYLELYSDQTRAAVFADSAQFAAEAIGAFRTVSSLTMERTIVDRYQALLSGHLKEDFVKSASSMALFAFSDSVTLLATALIFWYGTKLIVEEGYSATAFFVVEIALINGSEQAGSFFAHAPNLAASSQAANRMFHIRENDEERAAEAALAEMDWSEDSVNEKKTEGFTVGCSVELRDVTFTYPSRDKPVIHHLNIRIEPGQFVAFVGASGCGKSTLISLLMGFYPITSGRILVNGVDISTVKLPSYRRKIGLVAQEPVLYQGSISSNVRLGLPSTAPQGISEKEKETDEDLTSAALEPVKHACSLASVHTFIESLPAGYATDIGTSGLGLSGGQKQRLALARALITRPRLLLLDEATSSLDSHSEKDVLHALETVRGESGKNVTMIAVAHRLATIRDADCIFVLDEGRVIESGRHEELVGKKGVYYEMCLAQALDK